MEVNTVRDITEVLAKRYMKMIGFNKDQHLRNNCLVIIENINEWPLHKLSRRLGYIQKGVIEHNMTSIGKENHFTKPLFEQVEQKTFSDKMIVLFIDENKETDGGIVHRTIYEGYPNVASMDHLFGEIVTDDEFGMPEEYVKTLSVNIMTLTEYNKQYDEYLDMDFDKDYEEEDNEDV